MVLRILSGQFLSHLLTTWFVAVFVLMAAAGLGFVGSIVYMMVTR